MMRGLRGATVLELTGRANRQATLDGARRARRFLRSLSHRLDLSS